MSWLQVSIEIDSGAVEQLTEFFHEAGALSVTALDAGDEPLLEPAPGETPLWQRVRLVALMQPDTDTAKLQTGLAEINATVANLQIEKLADRDWSSTWRESFGAMRFGRRLWVAPMDAEVPDADAVVVRLDPGLAFGTGTHATTALCLEWLDAHMRPGSRVIDYGCGSGILAIAALKLGATEVNAVDIDPQALQASRENARRNGINTGLSVQFPDALQASGVDLVVANILANPLIELSSQLPALLADRGEIIMTGILAEQAESVMAAYRDALDFEQPVSRDEWVLLSGRKR